MRTLLLLIVLLGSTAANAQPGVTEPIDYYAPQPTLQLRLNEEQQALLARGEISIGKYVTGGVLSYVVGFGVGHAVQGRWNDNGWIFTFGEAASMTVLIYGLAQFQRYDYVGDYPNENHQREDRRARNYLLAGVVGLVGFRIWVLYKHPVYIEPGVN